MVALLALLAFVANAIVVPTHIHPHLPLVPSAGAFAPGQSHRGVAVVADDPCALCDALAAFEPYVPVAAVELHRELPPHFAASVRIAPRRLVQTIAHDWQSRAPPASRRI